MNTEQHLSPPKGDCETLQVAYAALAVVRSQTGNARGATRFGYLNRHLYMGLKLNEDCAPNPPTKSAPLVGRWAVALEIWANTRSVFALEWDSLGRFTATQFISGQWQEQLLRAADALTAPRKKPANDNKKWQVVYV